MNVEITVKNQDDIAFVHNVTIENFAAVDEFPAQLHADQDDTNAAHLEAENDHLVTNNVYTVLNVRVL